MENFTQWSKQSGLFSPKSGHFYSIFKKDRGSLSSSPSCAPVSSAEYASISLNIPKHSWKCLNKLFWIYQGYNYDWSSYMFDRLWKMPGVLNNPGFWKWHVCICKGYAEFRICLIMAPYASGISPYARIFFNVPQYAWTWLNIVECLRIRK